MSEQTVASTISHAINTFGLEVKKEAFGLATDHPTLQQTFMRLVLAFMEAEAGLYKPETEGGWIDIRNSRTREISHKVIEFLKKEYGVEDEYVHTLCPFI